VEFLTVGTTIDLSTETLGTTMLDRPHRQAMRGQEFVRIFFLVGGTILSKEVSQF
jgi:hypothetical protein